MKEKANIYKSTLMCYRSGEKGIKTYSGNATNGTQSSRGTGKGFDNNKRHLLKIRVYKKTKKKTKTNKNKQTNKQWNK